MSEQDPRYDPKRLSPEDQRIWRMEAMRVAMGERPRWTILPGPRLAVYYEREHTKGSA